LTALMNDGDVDRAMSFVADAEEEDDNDDVGVEFEFTDFPKSWMGRRELERNLRLILAAEVPSEPSSESSESSNDVPTFVIERTVYDPSTGREGILFHLEDPSDGPSFWTKKAKRGAAFFELTPSAPPDSSSSAAAQNNKPILRIRKAFVVKENDKSGEVSLKVLKVASDIISAATAAAAFFGASPLQPRNETGEVVVPSSSTTGRTGTTSSSSSPLSCTSASLPEQYFASWNERDMERACSVFSEDIEYDDTAFPEPFRGEVALRRHLELCADSMPSTFAFVLDDQVNDGNTASMVRWHLENGPGNELPFTRGCSLYEIEDGKIVRGTDLKEPAVLKTAGMSLFVRTVGSKLRNEPVRWVPLVVWITYLYVVFFSDWFFGAPVQSLEVRTWEEVRDLSLNFFLVSPVLGLPFAPVVHPGLEGIFNLLLSWAALFAGFLSDDRPRKANVLPMLPLVVGMQFLTSAFLLPYLVTRSNETERNVPRHELGRVAQATESRLLGVAMAIVGSGSILWGLFGRMEDFGMFPERFSSLMELLSIDRVGSSFVVDLAIFGLFQGWLVDDDLMRRGLDDTFPLARLAKFVPFFGLASYLILRPQLSGGKESETGL
jgi:ketosteroid isomerase-like protein